MVMMRMRRASRLAVTSLTHCEDPLPPQERGSFPELLPATGYEPNLIVDNQIVDDQENMSFTEIEDRVMSPTGLLKTRITGTSPETVSSLSSRMYVSDSCPTTSRFYLQPKTQRKASRRHRERTSMTNNFVLCWLHH